MRECWLFQGVTHLVQLGQLAVKKEMAQRLAFELALALTPVPVRALALALDACSFSAWHWHLSYNDIVHVC